MSARFFEKVDFPDDRQACWRWTGYRSPLGYGYITGDRATKAGKRLPEAAHRVSYAIHVGPIPKGLVLDHLCRNPWCVNPKHLEAVTNRENLRRARTQGWVVAPNREPSSACRRGHSYTEANTYWTKAGGRMCKRCHADNQLRRQRRLGVPPFQRGERVPTAKLTNEQALAIYRARLSGVRGNDLARQFGVDPSTICDIYKGRKYVDATGKRNVSRLGGNENAD